MSPGGGAIRRDERPRSPRQRQRRGVGDRGPAGRSPVAYATQLRRPNRLASANTTCPECGARVSRTLGSSAACCTHSSANERRDTPRARTALRRQPSACVTVRATWSARPVMQRHAVSWPRHFPALDHAERVMESR
jgi:hypothetical protein